MLPENWRERFRNLSMHTTIIKVSPETFLELLLHIQEPLVVVGTSGLLLKRNQYLATYKGIAFATTSKSPLQLPDNAEVLQVKAILQSRLGYETSM